MTKNSLIITAITAPLLVFISGYIVWNINIKNNPSNDAPTFVDGIPIVDEGSDEMTVSAIIIPGVEIIKTKAGTKIVETKSYGDALETYGTSGYRFQFSNCSGNPGTLTMKIGTKFMIDNRDSIGHQINIGTKAYKLAAYDFAILSIQKIGTFNIICDGRIAANVWIQK
jgi:hypothetical protein